MLQIAFSSCILIMNLSANSDQWQRLHPRDKVLDKQIQNSFAFCVYLNPLAQLSAQQRDTFSNYDAILLR